MTERPVVDVGNSTSALISFITLESLRSSASSRPTACTADCVRPSGCWRDEWAVWGGPGGQGQPHTLKASVLVPARPDACVTGVSLWMVRCSLACTSINCSCTPCTAHANARARCTLRYTTLHIRSAPHLLATTHITPSVSVAACHRVCSFTR